MQVNDISSLIVVIVKNLIFFEIKGSGEVRANDDRDDSYLRTFVSKIGKPLKL